MTTRTKSVRLDATLVLVPDTYRRPKTGDLVRHKGDEQPSVYKRGDLAVWALDESEVARKWWEVVTPVVIGKPEDFPNQPDWLLLWGMSNRTFYETDPFGGYRYGPLIIQTDT